MTHETNLKSALNLYYIVVDLAHNSRNPSLLRGQTVVTPDPFNRRLLTPFSLFVVTNHPPPPSREQISEVHEGGKQVFDNDDFAFEPLSNEALAARETGGYVFSATEEGDGLETLFGGLTGGEFQLDRGPIPG